MELTDIGDEEGLVWLQRAMGASENAPPKELAVLMVMIGSATRKVRSAEESIPILQKAIKLNPDAASAYYALTRTYEETSMIDDAKSTFRVAIEKDPKHLKAKDKLQELIQKD